MATKAEGDKAYDKAAQDEPIFVLRAQDRMAPDMVRLWAIRGEDLGVPRGKREEAFDLAARMEAWQKINGCKVPD